MKKTSKHFFRQTTILTEYEFALDKKEIIFVHS